jgi:low temperature requirement protein LtrA
MTTESAGAIAPEHDEGSTPRRVADWYELFFDLVFVVVIAISAEILEEDTSLGAVLGFLLLLFPLWWAWVNLMVTNNLFGARFASIGALVIAAMPGPAAQGSAHAGGRADQAGRDVAGAGWMRLVLLGMWLVSRAGGASSAPLWRPFAYNLGTAAIWLVSLGIPQPWQYLVWALAVAAEVLLLAVRSRFAYEIYERASVPHALERVGLFIVIVIGEAVYLAVTGLTEHPSLGGGAAALCGFLVCALLARTFFRWGLPTTEAGLSVAQRAQSYGAMRDVIMYLPFFLVAGLTLVAASIGIAVRHPDAALPPGARVLLACGVAVLYLVNAIIGLRLGRRVDGVVALVVPGVLLPVVACLGSGTLAAWATLALVAMALAVLELVNSRLGARGHAVPHE